MATCPYEDYIQNDLNRRFEDEDEGEEERGC
jgi:succinylglutamate desuccinylase